MKFDNRREFRKRLTRCSRYRPCQRADGARLPCRAHARDYGKEHGSLPGEPGVQQAGAPGGQQPKPYQADRAFHATLACLTGGISPIAESLAYFDSAWHLAAAPQRQMAIAQNALRNANKFCESAYHCFPPGQEPWSLIRPQPQDRHFANPDWEHPPFNLLAQAFLLTDPYCRP